MQRFLVHRREPFQIVFLALLISSGATQLLAGVVPGSIDTVLPSWFHALWTGAITLGSAVALGGILWRDVITGLYAERLGLTVAGWFIFIYGSAVLVVATTRGAVTAATCFAIVVAFYLRRRELSRVIRKLPRK